MEITYIATLSLSEIPGVSFSNSVLERLPKSIFCREEDEGSRTTIVTSEIDYNLGEPLSCTRTAIVLVPNVENETTGLIGCEKLLQRFAIRPRSFH